MASPLDSSPEIVYHYTNSVGLLGILSNQEIWLDDVEFMNDAEELVYSRSAVVANLEAKAESLWPAHKEDPQRSANWSRSQTIRIIIGLLTRDLDTPSGNTYHAYAACFCENPDLLSQWRGYAGEGGYAIGFRTDKLTRLSSGEYAADNIEYGQFAKVHYGLDAARKVIDAVIGNVAPHAKAHMRTHAWHQFMRSVLPVAATVKHPSFLEEQEWRLLHFSWGIARDVAFRTGRIGLVPYRRLALPVGSVASVVIGPGFHTEVQRASILQLLQQLDLVDIEVRASTSPLRR